MKKTTSAPHNKCLINASYIKCSIHISFETVNLFVQILSMEKQLNYFIGVIEFLRNNLHKTIYYHPEWKFAITSYARFEICMHKCTFFTKLPNADLRCSRQTFQIVQSPSSILYTAWQEKTKCLPNHKHLLTVIVPAFFLSFIINFSVKLFLDTISKEITKMRPNYLVGDMNGIHTNLTKGALHRT